MRDSFSLNERLRKNEENPSPNELLDTHAGGLLGSTRAKSLDSKAVLALSFGSQHFEAKMGSFRLPSLSSFPLEQTLAEISDPAKGFLRAGFKVIAGLSQSKAEMLAKMTMEHIDSLEELNTDQLATDVGLPADETGLALSAISLIIALISSRRETPEKLTAELVKANLLRESEAASVSVFLGVLARKQAEIIKTIGLSRLAEERLPAFQEFSASIDVRLSFKQDRIEAVVPVLIVHLATDLSSERLFFQMKRSDVIRLAEQLKTLASRLEQAETWANERLPKGD